MIVRRAIGNPVADQVALDGKQDADPDLTAIAALTPTNDDVLQRKAGAWSNRTPAQVKTDLALAKGDVGLGSVDNTADTAKPVSTAAQSALNLKAPLASPAFTGTPTGLAKAHVGLSDVDNTTDAAKPVSTAAQTALDGKQPIDADLTAMAGLDSTSAGALTTDGSGWIRKTYAQLKTALGLVKGDVGLGSVDNTADSAKPVSTAVQAALDALPIRGGFHIQSTRYIIPPGTKSTIAMVSGLEYATPIWLDNAGTVVRIGIEVTIAGTAGTVIRLGVRSADANYRPGAVIGETTVAGDAIASVEATVSFVIPTPGLYYLEAVAQSTGGTLPTLRALSSVTLSPVSAGSLAGVMTSASHLGYVTASGAVTGALPGTYPLSDRAGVVPVVALRG